MNPARCTKLEGHPLAVRWCERNEESHRRIRSSALLTAFVCGGFPYSDIALLSSLLGYDVGGEECEIVVDGDRIPVIKYPKLEKHFDVTTLCSFANNNKVKVYLLKDKKNGQAVGALKYLGEAKAVWNQKKSEFKTSSDIKYFAEARFGAKIDHPNILPCSDPLIYSKFLPSIGLKSPGFWVATNFEGICDMREFRFTPSRFQKLMVDEKVLGNRKVEDTFTHEVYQGVVCILMKQLASALEYLHRELGIVHGDVKPANVLVCEGDSAVGLTVKLIDLGLSRPLGTKSVAFGTSDYLAPEIGSSFLTHKPLIARETSDVFSFGATLYELLTGKSVYNNEGGKYRVVLPSATVESLRTLPKDMGNLLTGMLKVNPKERITLQDFMKSDWVANREAFIKKNARAFEALKNHLPSWNLDDKDLSYQPASWRHSPIAQLLRRCVGGGSGLS